MVNYNYYWAFYHINWLDFRIGVFQSGKGAAGKFAATGAKEHRGRRPCSSVCYWTETPVVATPYHPRIIPFTARRFSASST